MAGNTRAFEKKEKSRFDSKEFELPDTVYARDIDNRVFQGIVLQCLAKLDGVSCVEGNVFDNLLGRSADGIKGITAIQDPKKHSVSLKVEVKIAYGVSIPEKSDEIQTKIVEEVTKITGLHVSEVHVIFKGLFSKELKKTKEPTTLESLEKELDSRLSQ